MRVRDVKGTGRRGLLAGAAALVGAGLARLTGAERVDATHAPGGAPNADSLAMHVDQVNNGTQRTFLVGTIGGNPPMVVFNGSSPFSIGQADAVQGITRSNVGFAAGVQGRNQASTGQAIGVFGNTTSSSGTGVFGSAGLIGGAIPATAAGVGVYGSGNSAGVKGAANNGVGVIGASGGNIGVYGASSANVGVFGDADVNTAVMGRTGAGIGVYGTATRPGQGGRAAVFDGTVLVNGPFTVVGGPKSAGVRHPDGSVRRMYCQEGTEPYFEDVGRATLTNGRTEVTLDSDFNAVVKGDDYLVFLTPEADCKGLFVSRRGPNRFVVEELQGGKSTLGFSYRVMARRREDVGTRMEKVDVRPAQSRDVRVPNVSVPPVPERGTALPSEHPAGR